MADFTEGQLVEGTITKLTKFGAFAAIKGLEDFEIEGLIHISELSDRRIEHPKEVVDEQQIVTLRLIKIDRERRRIGLSLKRVDSAEYAEIDWQTAMQETESPEDEIEEAIEVEVEDFDAALETDTVDVSPAELEALTEEIEGAPDEEVSDVIDPIGDDEAAPEAIPQEAKAELELEASSEDAELQEAQAELPLDDPQDTELAEAEAEIEPEPIATDDPVEEQSADTEE